jgi:hypothetical protein
VSGEWKDYVGKVQGTVETNGVLTSYRVVIRTADQDEDAGFVTDVPADAVELASLGPYPERYPETPKSDATEST